MSPIRSKAPAAAIFGALCASLILMVPTGIGKPGIQLPLPEWDDRGESEDSFLSASLFPAPANSAGIGIENIPLPPLPPRGVRNPLEPFLEPLELQPLVMVDGGDQPELEDIPGRPEHSEILLEDFQVYRSQPENFLVNPQHLLSEPQEFDLTEFLDYHASESGIPIYILVADGDQRMPERFDLAGNVDLWFPDVPACVVLYYLGYPTRSEVVLSPPLRRIAGSISGVEILEHASSDALVASDAIDQLSRFAVRTSIRMFWLEKRFRSNTSDSTVAQESEFTFSAALTAIGQLFKSATFYAILFALAALVSGLYLLRSWWVSRTGGHVYVFPDFELNPRLGAPHSGGSHIVVDFERRD